MFKNELLLEVGVVFRKEQQRKKHTAPCPISIQVIEGCIDFGVNEQRRVLPKGSLASLEANLTHDLIAMEDSIVRLSLCKSGR